MTVVGALRLVISSRVWRLIVGRIATSTVVVAIVVAIVVRWLLRVVVGIGFGGGLRAAEQVLWALIGSGF